MCRGDVKMSLIIIQQPKTITGQKASDLPPGTWFYDEEERICAAILDDRSFERRIVCWGYDYVPFIAANPAGQFQVSKILPVGTIMQITASENIGVTS